MKKVTITLLLCASLLQMIAHTQAHVFPAGCVPIELNCNIVDKSNVSKDYPRTPVRVPEVYYDSETGILYFDNPCYECMLELIIPDTDNIVYSSAISNGADIFQIPSNYVGTYEIHIHRCNYCFSGVIELLDNNF